MSLMSEQIRVLKDLRFRLGTNSHRDTDWKIVDDAIDTIQTQGAKLAAYGSERSLQYYNHGWIPCEDRLPEEKGHYLVTVKLGNTGRTDVDFIWFNDGVFEDDDKWEVIAWTPRFEPYKKKKENEDGKNTGLL